MSTPVSKPSVVPFVAGLLDLNAFIWLGLSLAFLLRMRGNATMSTPMLWLVAILMFANAIAMHVAAVGLAARRRSAYPFAVAVLLLNLALTFTDQFGLLDMVTLILDVCLLTLLVTRRKAFWPADAATP